MKKLYLLLFVLCVGQAQAQVSDAWKIQIESTFQYVNRSYVTTGLLNDYGLYFTNIEKFNGIPSDTNYINLGEWQQLYTTVYSCRFNSVATIQEPAPVFKLIDSISVINSGKILFAGLHYKYERFKSNASPNLVYVSNNKIYDKPGRSTTPYEIKETFAVVPTLSSLEGAVHTFLFKPEFFYSNTGKTISTFKVDFADGTGYRTLSANTPLSITYSTAGIKTMRLKITYTDSTYKESRTKIEVTDIADPQTPQVRYGGTNIDEKNFPLTNFHSPKAWTGKVGKAKVTIEYTNSDKKVRKPLIIVEGFDPWKIANGDNPDKNFSFEDLISKDFSGKGLNVLINYTYETNYYATLSDALQGEDYDLIFVGFDDGTDYIQRNAYLVENIIEWVNSVKEPYNGVMQKNVVMGASMGGLVARYALRDMELSSPVINHDTRLYVSFDTPHQGANFPLGFQAMVSHLNGIGVNTGLVTGMSTNKFTFGNLSKDLGNSYRLLNSPAARQMLFYSVVGTGESISIDNSIHETFMADYVSKGYPQLNGIRNLVIANGSECGTNQGFEPYAEFINDDTRFRLHLYSKFLLGLTTDAGTANNIDDFFHNITPVKTDFRIQLNVNALPSQSAKRIYRGKIYIKKSILWGLITITTTLFDKSFDSPASYLPIDNNGGGVYDLEELAANLPVSLKLKRFSFVPTFSALDAGGGVEPITLADVTRSYSPSFPPDAPKNVRAANFFANPSESGASNEIHTQVTLRNGRWLFQEITGTPAFFSCSYQCANPDIQPAITGPDPICSGTKTYVASFVTPGTTVSWTNNWAVSYVSGQGTNSYTVQAATTSGSATINANISGECEAKQLSKTIWVGSPWIDGTYNGGQLLAFTPYPLSEEATINYNQVCSGPYNTVNLSISGSTSTNGSWQKTYSNPSNIVGSSSGNNLSFYFWAPGQTAIFRFTTGNTCGSTANNYYFEAIDCSGDDDPCNSVAVSPNPAETEINIVAPNVTAPCETAVARTETDTEQNDLTITSITLLDMNGEKVFVQEFTTGIKQTSIDTSGFRKGVYFLKISIDGVIETHRIIINK